MKPHQVWMHPRRTARLIDGLEKELARERENSRVAQQQSRQQADALREEAANARGLTSRTREQLDDLQKKHDALRQKFETEMQQHATLFTDSQHDIDELKAGYERRIEHLHHALADAHALLADRGDYEALRQMTLIDMTSSATAPAAPEPAPAVSPETPGTSDWLEPLPD